MTNTIYPSDKLETWSLPLLWLFIIIIQWKTQNVEFGSHQTKMSEKQKAIGQSAPSGHQGVHQSGDLVKDHA